jgi:hypothetical protein
MRTRQAKPTKTSIPQQIEISYNKIADECLPAANIAPHLLQFAANILCWVQFIIIPFFSPPVTTFSN